MTGEEQKRQVTVIIWAVGLTISLLTLFGDDHMLAPLGIGFTAMVASLCKTYYEDDQ
jgi:hypothetical protein